MIDDGATGTAAARWLRRAFVFAVAGFVWWRVADNTADNDLWGHVLYGQRMLHFRGLEATDVLSWTAAGQPWINHEVLAELALGATHLLAGGTGLWLLMVGLAAVTIGLAWREGAGRDGPQRTAALVLLALTTNSIALGYAVRPQLFTFLFFVVLLLALRRLLDGRLGWGLALPALLAVWVNTHGGFLAGWLFLVVAAFAELAARSLPSLATRLRCRTDGPAPMVVVNLVLVATLALIANPWGWKLIFWTIETVRLPRPTIGEWHATVPGVATLPFYATVALGLAAWLVSRAPRRAAEMALWALCAILAIRHQRHAPLFGLASLVFLPVHLVELARSVADRAANLRRALGQPALALGFAVILAIAGLAGFGAGAITQGTAAFRVRVPRDLYPVAAIEFMRERQLTGRTITFFDWGQQVLWELPGNPVSFDGRLDTVYPGEVMDAHWRLYAGEEPGPGLDPRQGEVALLPATSPAIAVLADWSWRIVYRDPVAVVMVFRWDLLPAGFRPSTAGPEAATGAVAFPDRPAALAAGQPR